jgi:hypothetical protein
MDYHEKYLIFKLKYLALKKKLGGLFPYKISDDFPTTKFYEPLYIYNCSYLPGYDFPYVNIEKAIPKNVLDKIEKRFEKIYQKNGFDKINDLIIDGNLIIPNNTVFTYVLFPTEKKINNFGFKTDINIRFHRVESAFEIHTKHNYIIKKYAESKNLNVNDIEVYCGGEFKLTTNSNNEIDLILNRKSGTLKNCWEENAPEVKLNELFHNKTGINVKLITNSMLDKSSNNYEQFLENYDYLKEISDLGVTLNFFENCPSQFDKKEPEIKYINDIFKINKKRKNTPEKNMIKGMMMMKENVTTILKMVKDIKKYEVGQIKI